MRLVALLATLILSALAPLGAADSPINGADSAWVMGAGAWVLLMTIPGLALFYGGLVRTKNVLTVLAQCLAITGLVTILWMLYGYSLAFGGGSGTGALAAVIGGGSRLGLLGLEAESVSPLAGSIPESVFICFQLTFAVITPALLVGAFAERLRFQGVMLLAALWLTVVYVPIAHMAWGGEHALMGGRWGLLDFAGGTVVEVNSGIAGLVCALWVGRRAGYPHEPMKPHNLVLCLTGAGLLWVGWFGFNAGSALAAGATAGMAMLTTQIAGSAAALAWGAIEWRRNGRPSALGIASGAIGGLVAITPACGFVGPMGALVIGLAAGGACWAGVTLIKARFGYDDALDVFGVHGIGGMVGLLLTGVFCVKGLGGAKDVDLLTQVVAQAKSMGLTIVWSGLGTVACLWLTDRLVGLRASEHEEVSGLDLHQHGEVAYNG